MAGEFKIKTGLLLGPEASTQSVNLIKDTSVSITTDASTILVTGKAIYDFVSSELNNVGGDASIGGLTDTSLGLPNALSTNDLLVYDASTSKWYNRPDYWVLDTSTVPGKTTISTSDSQVSLLLTNIEISGDSGAVTFLDMNVTSDASEGTEESYGFNIDGIEIMKIYSESDGLGSLQNIKLMAVEDFEAQSNVSMTGLSTGQTAKVLYYNTTSGEVTYGDVSTAAATAWGTITGTLSDQTDLYNPWLVDLSTRISPTAWGGITGTLSDQSDLYTPWLVDLSTNISTKLENTTDTFSGILTVDGSVRITKDLTIDGSVTYINTTNLDVSDNIIQINSGLTGTPVGTMVSGMRVNRGSEDPYFFIFSEDDDTFRVGTESDEASLPGATQAVATREDEPASGGIAFWNNTAKRFDTSINFTTDGKDVSIGGKAYFTGIDESSGDKMVYYDSTTHKISYSDAPSGISTLAALTDVSIGGTIPDGSVLIYNSEQQKWNYGFLADYWKLVGSTLVPTDPNVDVQLSSIQIGTDAGSVVLVEMDVSSASSDTEESYSFNIKDTTIAKVYAESDGAGDIKNSKFISLEAFEAEASVYFTGIDESSQTKALYYNTTSGEVTYDDVSTGGAAGSAIWGGITGNLEDQTDVSTAIDAKLDKSGGTISGNLEVTGTLDLSGISEASTNKILFYNTASNTITYGDASVGSSAGDYWTLDGSILRPSDNTVNVELSAIQVYTDAGAATLVDMDVSSATTGTEESYSFDLDGSTIAKVWGEAQTGGTLNEIGFVVETAQYMGDPRTDGSWRFYVDGSGDLVFEKRISGAWTQKGKFTE